MKNIPITLLSMILLTTGCSTNRPVNTPDVSNSNRVASLERQVAKLNQRLANKAKKSPAVVKSNGHNHTINGVSRNHSHPGGNGRHNHQTSRVVKAVTSNGHNHIINGETRNHSHPGGKGIHNHQTGAKAKAKAPSVRPIKRFQQSVSPRQVAQQIAEQFSSTGWRPIGKNQIPAYGVIRVPFIAGFESSTGSQFFASISNRKDHKRYTAGRYGAVAGASMGVFDTAFKILKKSPAKVENHPSGLQSLHIDFIGDGDGQHLSARRGIPTRYSSFFVPYLLPGINNKGRTPRFGSIFLEYRGKESDRESYQQVYDFIGNIVLPDGVRPLRD